METIRTEFAPNTLEGVFGQAGSLTPQGVGIRLMEWPPEWGSGGRGFYSSRTPFISNS